MSAANEKRIEAFLGESGSGKSTRIKLILATENPSRLMVWDPKLEYSRFGVVTDRMGDVNRMVERKEAFRVIFQPKREHRSVKAMRSLFDAFCTIAGDAGRLYAVPDELADVTEPGWAPEGWERLTRQGRHDGLVILGASQSPTGIDKTFYQNCSAIWVFQQGEANSIERMASLLALNKEDKAKARIALPQLAPHECIRLIKSPRAVEKIIASKSELRRAFQ